MSRQIDYLGHKLTAEERQYYITRGRRSEILINDRRFGPEGTGVPAGADDEEEVLTWEEEVGTYTVAELKAELAARDLDTSGNKAELQARLIESGPDEDDSTV